MKAVLCSANYGDILSLTLPRNRDYFDRIVVATTPRDTETQAVCKQFENVTCLVTNAFHEGGAELNKGAAMDEALSVVGRSGWIVILDADIVLPESAGLGGFGSLTPGILYGCQRRILEDISAFSGGIDWSKLPDGGDRELAGYFQLFHSSDPVLAGREVWYEHCWRHAGVVDSRFNQLWPRERQRLLPFEVLHLGPVARNWFGRATPRLDGTLPAGAEESAERMQRMIERRRNTRGRRQKFAGEKVGAAAPMPPQPPE